MIASDKRKQILGVPVDMVNRQEALSIYEDIMEQDGCGMIVTPNSEIVIHAEKNQLLKQIISQADLILPDGIGLVYASKIIGSPLNERVTGIDFLDSVLAKLESKGQSIFFLGSKPGEGNELGVAAMAAKKMQEKYPSLKVAGTHHGYFKEKDEEAIINKINHSGADFLCVALGSPKQEEFVYRHKKELKVKCAIGVGGSLDVWAGTLKRAPEFYRNNGLEWLFRLIQEPRRYKRMAVLPVFMIKVVISRMIGGEKNVG